MPEPSASDRPLRVLQVGTLESGGGAASVARNLMRGYRARGCETWMAVGRPASNDPDVFVLADGTIQRQLRRMAGRSSGRGWGWLSRSLRLAAHPRALLEQVRGHEDFEFPATFDLLNLAPARPDILHCHNLHGDYFDLRALKWLSRQLPTVLTLHDAWLLSGHCAHSFDCDRWKTGCGACPDLAIYPAIRRDATAANWIRKRDVYAGSRLYVAAPSRWLMDKLDQSMLAPAVQQARVIPNGVDVATFRPADKALVRRALGIAPERAVVLLTIGRHGSPWGDDQMLGAATALIAARTSKRDVLFVAVGDAGAPRTAEEQLHRVASQSDPKALAQYYQAADVYLHCARIDTFPNTILEALACGTPVVASSVGGIPEQIRSADSRGVRTGALNRLERATGLLVAAGDAEAMAASVVALLGDGALRRRLGDNAARDVRDRFDLNRQVESYLAWYRTIIEHWNGYAKSERAGTPAGAAGPSRMAVD